MEPDEMELTTVNDCVWVDQNTIRAADHYVKTTFRTPDGYLYVIGTIEQLHELANYQLVGVYDDSFQQRSLDTANVRPFRLHRYSFKKLKESADMLIRCGKIFKEINGQFRSQQWKHLVQTWIENPEHRDMLLEEVLRPKIRYYASVHASVSFWVESKEYSFFFKLYGDMAVFDWTRDIILAIREVYDSNPYTLCYETPHSKMKSVFANVDRLEQLVPPESHSDVEREAVSVATQWFDNRSAAIRTDEVSSQRGAQLLVERGYLVERAPFYLRKKFVDLFTRLQGCHKIACDRFADMAYHCQELAQKYQGKVSFVVTPHIVVDRKNYPTNISLETPEEIVGKAHHVVILHAELWTLTEMEYVLDACGNERFMTILGLCSYERNRLGYNFFHYFGETRPTGSLAMPELTDLNKKADVGNRRSLFSYAINETSNFAYEVRQLPTRFKKRNKRTDRMTFVSDDPTLRSKIKYALESNGHRNLYTTHQRVIKKRESLVITRIYDISPNGSKESKRKRELKTTADDVDKRFPQRIVEFHTGECLPLRVCQHQLAPWSVLTTQEARSLHEEVIFYFTTAVRESVVHSLRMNTDRLVVVTYGTESFDQATADRLCKHELQVAELLTS